MSGGKPPRHRARHPHWASLGLLAALFALLCLGIARIAAN